MPTGWFGVPGKLSSRNPKVHYVYRNKPICGSRMAQGSEFQVCATGFDERMIECKRCIAELRRERKVTGKG